MHLTCTLRLTHYALHITRYTSQLTSDTLQRRMSLVPMKIAVKSSFFRGIYFVSLNIADVESFYHDIIFGCGHATLKEALSVRGSVGPS